MNRGILHSAVRNPRLRLELEYREPATDTSGVHSSWTLARVSDLGAGDSAAWFEFCRAILQSDAASKL